MKKWIALFLSLCMLLSATALAETVTEELPVEAPAVAENTLADDQVLATLYGEDITWGQIASTYEDLIAYYGSYYDLSLQENVDLFRAVALDSYITGKVVDKKAQELNIVLTEEEKAAAEEGAQSDWDAAIQEYMAGTEGATEEDAVAYFTELGYSPESLKADYVEYATDDKIRAHIIQDVVVTDEDVETYYQELVAADKELYGSDVSAYESYNSYVYQMEMYSMYYGTESNMDRAWYRPAGFRLVKHILLPVDEALMTEYQSLQAQLEEQMAGEAANAEEGIATTDEPVTQEQVDAAKAAILDSVSGTVQEINDKLAAGATFDELMVEYSMDYQPTGTNTYEVSVASTLTYVPEFVEAAFSVDNVGDVSAPYISTYGVHILLYVEDIPEGPIEMTEEQRQLKYEQLLATRQDEQYTSTVEGWIAEAGVTYTGVISDLNTLMAEMEAAEENPVEEEAPVEETTVDETTEEVPAE
ncbi:MAG: peptidylprolyl isomerase [Clostridia bacterium]|nr:peptidylprolyl isomerase [Clostridia bacterium]